VTKLIHWVGASAAAVALGLFAITAEAQQKAPAAKAPEKKAASPCQGIDEKACAANAECTWVAATKTKAGKEVKAYCRAKPKTEAKAPAAKPADKKK
jgi:hypothetical protein